MSFFELFIPLMVFVWLVCFDHDDTNDKGAAILIAFFWVIWTIALGSRL